MDPLKVNPPNLPNIKLENNLPPKKMSRAKAIQICQEKYPKEFKRKKILTLVIAISAIALLLIPLTATGLAALSICTFEIGLLIVTPIAILGISILIKKIDDKSLYWSGGLARLILDQKEKEARQKAEKAKKIEVKLNKKIKN